MYKRRPRKQPRKLVWKTAPLYRKPRPSYPEKKAIDVAASYVLNTTGSVALLNGCPRGDNLSERIGRRITMKNITLRGVAQGTTATGVSQLCRVIVVYDKQTNGVAPAVTDVLVSATGSAFMNLSYSKRFKIIIDKQFTVQSSLATDEKDISLYEYRKLNDQVEFNNGDAGTVADITTGALWLITVGSEAAGATAGAVPINTRVRFTDN